MRQILKVNINDDKEYLIDISDCSFAKFNQELSDYTKGQRRLFVISKKVYKLYKNILNINEQELFVFPDGEKEKNYNNYLKIINKAIKLNLTRKDVIIAIGGGVVGDIAGFAAATYMRGIDFIQVPTTLLAAVDSSVGGKTAIDLPLAKNIIGTFYQPKKVFINTNFFDTLDNKQFMSGMGEVIKYALIEDSCNYEKQLFLFEFLTLSTDKILQKEPITIIRMIEYCLQLKIAVVQQDEKESGLRKILNLGHTYGHALETITKYKTYTHGEAVIYGIFFIIEYAYNNNYVSYSYYKLILNLLEKYGFKPLLKKFPPIKILNIMKKDKKSEADNIIFIVPCDKKQVKEVKISIKDTEAML